MREACEQLEAEIEALENESKEVLDDIKMTVGDLSDLRYGKFNPGLGVSSDLCKEVVQGLKQIETICDTAGEGLKDP